MSRKKVGERVQDSSDRQGLSHNIEWLPFLCDKREKERGFENDDIYVT